MAISVGGIEAFLDLKVGPFNQSTDNAKKKLDDLGNKADETAKKIANIGPKLSKIGQGFATVGAGITAAFVPALLAAEKTNKAVAATRASVGRELGLLNQEVGTALATVLVPALQALERGIKIARDFADTGIGRIVIQATFVVGVLATFGGGLLLLVGKIATTVTAIQGLSAVMGTLNLTMVAWAPGAALIVGALAGLAALALAMKAFEDEHEKRIDSILEKQARAETLGAVPSEGTIGGAPALGGKTFASSLGDLGAQARGADEGMDSLNASIESFGQKVEPLPDRLADLIRQLLLLQEDPQVSLLEAGPLFSESFERDIEPVAERQAEVLTTPWEEATSSAIRFGENAFQIVSATTTLAAGLADTITSALIGSIQNAGKSFAQFFKQFMTQIASMIARAVILSALLSFLPGGGGFGQQLGKFFGKGAPFDEPRNDQMLRTEAGRMADLLLQGMSSRMDQTSGGAETRVASSEVERSSFAPVVEVHEATEMTWVRVTDRHIEPRIRERLDRQTVRS